MKSLAFARFTRGLQNSGVIGSSPVGGTIACRRLDQRDKLYALKLWFVLSQGYGASRRFLPLQELVLRSPALAGRKVWFDWLVVRVGYPRGGRVIGFPKVIDRSPDCTVAI